MNYTATREPNGVVRVTCLKCCVVTIGSDKRPEKYTSQIICYETPIFQKALSVAIIPVPGYKPSFESLPRSEKNRLINVLLKENFELHDWSKIKRFNECYHKRCVHLKLFKILATRKSINCDFSKFTINIALLDFILNSAAR